MTQRSRAARPTSRGGPPPDAAQGHARSNVAAGDPAVVAPPALGRAAAHVLLLYTATLVLFSTVFAPQAAWPVVFVALVPWGVATLRAQRAWLVHWLSFLFGWAFFLFNLRWLLPVTGLGYVALALYLAFYWTLAAWALRTARRHGVAAIWTLPVVWVACEYLRAWVMTGFPWLFLSHSLYAQLPLVQISDLTGAYGVSFLVALVNGCLIEAALRRWPSPATRPLPRQLRAGVVATITLLAATVAYGLIRMRQADFANDPSLLGPRVAVVQADFPLTSDKPVYREHQYPILATYLALAAAAAGEAPDLVAFPETVWGADQNLEFVETGNVVSDIDRNTWKWGVACHQAIAAFARGEYAAANAIVAELEKPLRRLEPEDREALGLPAALPRLPGDSGPAVTALVGAVSVEQFPEAVYPKAQRYNSALVYDPDGVQRSERYDKNHLVPFGEVVPFRQKRVLGIDLHWLYRKLNAISPFSRGGEIEYSLTAGAGKTVFELPTARGVYRFGAPICYEDVMPYVVREFVWDGPRRRVDFLVNISNDGWFHYRAAPPPWLDWAGGRWLWSWLWRSNELPQHLAICSLRAVENRVGIARAVNTGMSGFIDPNGRIYAVVSKDGRAFGPGVTGYAVQPVYLDRRTSLYGRFGDWFAAACLLLTAVLWGSAIFERWILAIRHRLAALRTRRNSVAGAR